MAFYWTHWHLNVSSTHEMQKAPVQSIWLAPWQNHTAGTTNPAACTEYFKIGPARQFYSFITPSQSQCFPSVDSNACLVAIRATLSRTVV
jgi:hypothetical protein